MDKPTPKDRIDHVLNCIRSIREFVKDSNAQDFTDDIKLQSAVLYQFLIIGEAIRNIDQSILSKYSYPWHIPRSFRNFIIHEYHGISMERIYFAANDLKGLEDVMKLMLENEF
ncbi:MAG: HepT-like ribonuclease domain-containing protein [Saprospiraceae bacterium]